MRTLLLFIVVSIISVGYCPVDGAAIEDEIYHGFNAVRGQFPYQTLNYQIGLDGRGSFCGGSLISTQWVLTAAHCAYRKKATTVYMGLLRSSNRANAIQFFITQPNHFVHPDYNPINIHNDIGLLKLPHTVNTSQYINTIKLPTKSQGKSSTFDNQMATASGWGQTHDSPRIIAEILQYRTLHVFPHAKCATEMEKINPLTDGMICTDKKVVNAGICPGDSGGPLTVNGTDGTPIVIGASSWLVGTCSGSHSTVFVNVAYYLNWINNVSGIAID